MGNFFEINDTLQITREQGFPAELDLEQHAKEPLKVENFKNQVFEFKDKPAIRIYKPAPDKNFLVENRNGKWIYWGLIHIIEVTHDYLRQTTSGKYKIICIYTPEEMRNVHNLTDRREDFRFFDNE